MARQAERTGSSHRSPQQTPARRRPRRRRALILCLTLAAGFAVVAGQLARLGQSGGVQLLSTGIETLGNVHVRPDILDRKGRLIATDIEVPSLYADPSKVIDIDEAAEEIGRVLTDLDQRALRHELADRSRRFIWVRRGLDPADAAAIHNLGVPGLGFRNELKRVYPGGAGLGPVIGQVDVDNQGLSGIERAIDESGGIEQLLAPERTDRPPVMLSIDLSVQHAVSEELTNAMTLYGAKAAAAVVLNVRTGEVIAAASLPGYGAGDTEGAADPARTDRLMGGTYELGSVFKTITLAMAEEAGILPPGRLFDATLPIEIGRYSIDDFHPVRRLLTAEEVFIHSSNIGAARMADMVGEAEQQRFLRRLGLLEAQESEAGRMAPPQLPRTWSRISTLTVSYGHGIAVAPLQFAAAAATLVGSGRPLKPTFLMVKGARTPAAPQVVGSSTLAFVRHLLRENVVNPQGTGRRAAVAGYDVGGKTGTADIPTRGGYSTDAVITSFLAAFPVHAPRYVTYVVLFEPRTPPGEDRHATAGTNAAPATARIIGRIAPILGLAPQYENDGT